MTAPTPGRCRIAICDDSTPYVELVALVLGSVEGFEVVGTAANGQAGIELCGREQPDVLLLDVAMPVLDGIAALPEIRRVSPGTRVVMLTGFDSDDVRHRALDLGAHAFRLKGIDPEALIDAVRAACGDDDRRS